MSIYRVFDDKITASMLLEFKRGPRLVWRPGSRLARVGFFGSDSLRRAVGAHTETAL